MSGIWICHIFDGGRCAASLEGNKRIRREEAFPVCGEKESQRQKEDRSVGINAVLMLTQLISASHNLVNVLYLAAKEPAAATEKNEQQFKGLRKKQMKARLIIRNLSFKVQCDYEMQE